MIRRRALHFGLCLGVACVFSAGAGRAATIIINNNDGAGEGFNDPMAVSPVGGNPGTTLGAQRLNAFQFAADLFGFYLNSAVTIEVDATMDPKTCDATSAILGSAGTLQVFRDWSGAPFPATWYHAPLANALLGFDADTGVSDIGASFNSDIDFNNACLQNTNWYYGFDGNAGGDIEFVTVVLHEIGHGLGVSTFVNKSTGARLQNFDDIYMHFLEDHSLALMWPAMTNPQRANSATDDGDLHWVGPNVQANIRRLTAGFDTYTNGHVQMYAPNTLAGGSSVSHWDTDLTPSELMEPFHTGALHDASLAFGLLQDEGWTLQNYPGLGSCDVHPSPSPYLNTTPVARVVSPNAFVTGTSFLWERNGARVTGAADQRLDSRALNSGDVLAPICATTDGTVTGTPTLASTPLTIQNVTSPVTSAAANGLWNMVSVPLQTGDHLADDFTVLYGWDEASQGYFGGADASRPATITPGEGYWGHVDPAESEPDGGREIDGTGTTISGPTFDVLGLTNTGGSFSGRHLMGNPFVIPIAWSAMQFRQAGGGSYVDVATAAGNGWIENNIWMRYDNTAGQYLPLVGGGVNGTVYPFEGFWLHALTDVDVRFDDSGVAAPPPVRESGVASPAGWLATLAATAGPLRDDYNAFGMHVDASDGWDPHDATDGGTLNADHVVLTFAGGADPLAHDVRPLTVTAEWDVVVDAVGTGPVTLSWKDTPAGYAVTLVDTHAGAVVAMHGADSYSYTPARDAELRTPHITADRIDAVSDRMAGDAPLPAATPSASGGGCVAAAGDGPAPALYALLALSFAVLRKRA